MKTIKFTIRGNQEDQTGNPIPYMRSTQGGQWKPKVIRYHEWKSYVVAQYIDALEVMSKEERLRFKDVTNLSKPKPIVATTDKIIVNLKIVWKDKTHGDCDNIFKGIADALFMNDKYVAGCFDYEYGDVGSVTVEIIWK